MKRIQTIITLDIARVFIFGFIMAFSTPIIRIYMVSHVDPAWFKASLAIDALSAGALGMFMTGKRYQRLSKYFDIFCIVSSVSVILINVFFGNDPNFRFIAISLTYPLGSFFVMKILKNIYNNKLEGNDLSTYESRKEGAKAFSGFFGFIIAIYIDSISIDTALMLQCISAGLDGLCSIYISNKLKALPAFSSPHYITRGYADFSVLKRYKKEA